MTPTVTRSAARLDSGVDSGMHIAVAYENIQAGVHGKLTLGRVARGLSRPGRLQISFWPFRLLENPAFCGFAAEQAATAEVLVISASGLSPLPGGVREWLRQSIGQECSQPRALAALLHDLAPERAAVSPISISLANYARHFRLDLLSAGTAAAPRGEHEASASFEGIIQRAHTLTPLLRELLHQTHSRP